MTLPTGAGIDVVLDLKEFIRIPRTYFQAVSRREPRQLAEATETVIFQRSDLKSQRETHSCTEKLLHRCVKYFQQLRASTLGPLAPEQRFESCDLRVLETTTKQAWETVRRIVISSFAGEKNHWSKEFCKSHFFAECIGRKEFHFLDLGTQ